MTEIAVPIYFYIPQEYFSAQSWPKNADEYWEWQCQQDSISPMQSGGFFWTLQTYLCLNDNGFPCKLVDTLPAEGIIIAHRDFLDESIQPNSKQLFVCLRADVDRHPYAQLHVVQNLHQAIPKKSTTLWESHFIPHWPQPDIIPRNRVRGDRFENVTFIGNQINLGEEFQDDKWYAQLQKLGLKFHQQLTHQDWNNYQDTDVILAIRKFGTDDEWYGKPASKLYNAWLAGIPAILGYESAFRDERKNELDYLEVTSYEAVVSALKRLQEDKNLRLAMVENGWLRAKEVQKDEMVAKWQSFIINVATPRYEQWCSLAKWQQKIFFVFRNLFIYSRPTYYVFKSLLKSFKK
ncbi:MAG: hypothetical protein ACFB02_20470 [Mastigocoleus sp.]